MLICRATSTPSPQGKLLEQVAKKVADSRVLELVEAMLRQGVMEGLAHWTPEAGTPQGAVVSPLLSNIYLDPLDTRWQTVVMRWCAMQNDFVILCRNEAEGQSSARKSANAGRRMPGCDCIRKRPASSTPRNVVALTFWVITLSVATVGRDERVWPN